METICKQNDVSSNFVTQANSVLALDVFAKNERKITRDDVNIEPGDDGHKIQVKRFAIISKLPLQVLEQGYVDTLKQTSTAELAQEISMQDALAQASQEDRANTRCRKILQDLVRLLVKSSILDKAL